jgi:hypothetical protein
MVLPEWIEHSTSPLPRGCSTTELRQQKKRKNLGTARTRRKLPQGPPVTQGNAGLAQAAAGHIIEIMDRTHKGSETRKNGSRNDRLAGALRENLRRRKAQERARGETQTAGTAEKPGQTRRDDPV